MFKYWWSQNEKCVTKPPILEWDKTADFENGTKPSILKMRQKRRFVIIQVASLGLSPKKISMKLKYHYTKQPILIFAS